MNRKKIKKISNFLKLNSQKKIKFTANNLKAQWLQTADGSC